MQDFDRFTPIIHTLTGDITEAEIIALIKRRSQEGYDLLYDKYAAIVYGSVMKSVVDPDKAGLILHQVFVQIWQSIDSFEPQKCPLNDWIQHIVTESIEEQAKTKQQDNVTDNISDKIDNIGHQSNPADINILSAEQAAVVNALFVEGYSYKEAALVLALPVDTIRTRMKEALKILRER